MRLVLPIYLALLLGASAVFALEGPVAVLEPYLGVWQVEAEWAGGGTVEARAEYTAGIGGRCVVGSVVVSDDGGEPYQRYFSVMRWDPDTESLVAHNFMPDGTCLAQEFTVEGGSLIVSWDDGGGLVRDRTTVEGDSMHWVVDFHPPGATEMSTIMDARWHRVTDAMTEPKENAMTKSIDTSLFAAGGADVRSFTKETTIAAPVEAVYAAWTDGAAFRAAFDPTRPELRADIDLEIGGRYEWLWDGTMGSNGCQVLSFIPNRMVSFSWNAPQDQPLSRARHTWVVVEFEPAGEGKTHVTLTHLGFGSEPHWDETFEYFSNAWPFAFEQMRKHLEG